MCLSPAYVLVACLLDEAVHTLLMNRHHLRPHQHPPKKNATSRSAQVDHDLITFLCNYNYQPSSPKDLRTQHKRLRYQKSNAIFSYSVQLCRTRHRKNVRLTAAREPHLDPPMHLSTSPLLSCVSYQRDGSSPSLDHTSSLITFLPSRPNPMRPDLAHVLRVQFVSLSSFEECMRRMKLS